MYLTLVKKSNRWRFAQFLEIRWWKRYLSDKDPEQYLIWKKKYWQDLLAELNSIEWHPEDQVLDAGCGPAGIFIALDNYQVKAVDPLLDAYKQLPHFRSDKFPHVSFETRPIESLNQGEKFDIVFCLNAINHVSDIRLAYDNLCNSVQEHGQLIVSIDAHRFQILKKIFQLLPGDVLHPHQYDLKEYERFLTERGFKIKQTLLKTPGNIFDYYVQVATKI